MKLTIKLGKIILILIVLIMVLSLMLSCEDTSDTESTTASESTADTIAGSETTLPTDPAVRPEPDEFEIIAGFGYFVKSFNSELYLSVEGDFKYAGFTQEDFTSTADQMFVFTRLDNGNYTIRALGTKAAYLDTENGDGERDGALLEATEIPNAEGSHEWIIKHYANGTYSMRSKISGNIRAIDIQDFSKDPGGRVFLWTGGTQANQRWFLELVADKPAVTE